MASGDWRTILETGAERDLGKLGNPALIREARETIDDLQSDPLPPGAVKMRRHNDAYRVKFGADAYRIVYRVDRKRRVIRVFAIGSRGTVYRGIEDETRFSKNSDCRPEFSLEGSSVHA